MAESHSLNAAGLNPFSAADLVLSVSKKYVYLPLFHPPLIIETELLSLSSQPWVLRNQEVNDTSIFSSLLYFGYLVNTGEIGQRPFFGQIKEELMMLQLFLWQLIHFVNFSI